MPTPLLPAQKLEHDTTERRRGWPPEADLSPRASQPRMRKSDDPAAYVAPLKAGREGLAAGRLPQQPAREPDEIHIHIGRIEVTAAATAPATAVRAVQESPRRGPSLEQYLKQGSRR